MGKKNYKTGIPVLCPICKAKIVFYVTGTNIAGDATINVICKRCGEVSIDTAYIKKVLPTQRLAAM